MSQPEQTISLKYEIERDKKRQDVPRQIANLFEFDGKQIEKSSANHSLNLFEKFRNEQGTDLKRNIVRKNTQSNRSLISDKDKLQQDQPEGGDIRFNYESFNDSITVDSFTKNWENILIICILYNSFTFAYFMGLPGFPTQGWLYIEIMVEVFSILDIFIRYFLRIYLIDKSRVMDSSVQLNLLHGSNDSKTINKVLYCLSSLPSSMFLYPLVSIQDHDQIWIALIRGLKLYRIKQLNFYFDVRDIRSKRQNFLRTFQASLYILLVTHYLACFWLFIGRVDPQKDRNWMNLMNYDKYEDVPHIQMYCDSLFFSVISMTGLGLTPMYPRTDLEYAIHSLMMLMGVSLYLNFFAFFAVTIYKNNRQRIENMINFEESRQLCTLRGFPRQLRFQIRDYYNNLRLDYMNLQELYNANAELPQSIKQQLSISMNKGVVEKVNFFTFIDSDLVEKMSSYLQLEIAQNGTFILMRGEVANRMYFIKQGSVDILASDEKTKIALMYQGSYFGEIGVLITGKRSCSVRSKSDTIFLCISKQQLLDTFRDTEIIIKYLTAVGRQRLKTTKVEDLVERSREAKPSGLGWLANLIKPQKNSSSVRNSIQLHTQDSKIMTSQLNASKTSKFYLTEEFSHLQCFIVIPFSNMYKLQTFLIFAAYFYNIVYVPFSIALDYDLPNHLKFFDYIAYLIYLFDTLIRPFHAIDKNYEILMPKKGNEYGPLIKQYVQQCFLFDSLSTIPFDYLVLLIKEGSVSAMYKHFRLFRLFKLYRFVEIAELARKKSTMNVLLMRIWMFVFGFIVVVYWFNCMLIYVSRQETFHGEAKSRFDGQTMIGFVVGSVTSGNIPLSEWNAWDMYANFMITATSWSVTFGDVMPFTISEEIVAILQIIIGRLLMAFFFAEVSSFVGLKFSAYDDHHGQHDIVRTWLLLNGLSVRLKKRVDRFFAVRWQIQRGVREEDLIRQLPSPMVSNILSFLFSELFSQSTLLKEESQNSGVQGMLNSIANRLQRCIIPKGEFIIKQGELADSMYFIMRGEVEIVNSEGTIIATLIQNMHFGEMALIEDNKSKVRTTSAIAKTNVILAVLSNQNFKLICHSYPEFESKLIDIVRKRANNLQLLQSTNQLSVVLKPQSINQQNNDSVMYSSRSHNEDHHSYLHPQHEDLDIPHHAHTQLRTQHNQFNTGPITLMNRTAFGGFGANQQKQINTLTQFSTKMSKKTNLAKIRMDSKLVKNSKHTIKGALNDGLEGVSDQDEYSEESKNDDDIGQVQENESQSSDSLKSSYQSSHLSNQNQNSSPQNIAKIPLPDKIQIEASMDNEIFQTPIAHYDTQQQSDQIAHLKQTLFTERAQEVISDHIFQEKNNETPLKSPKEVKFHNIQDPQKLSAQHKLSSSLTQIDEYLQQARLTDMGAKASLVSIFFFYAFKYFVILPLSIYNLVFIPLQMGFHYKFNGWTLFLEILTIIAYSLDVVMIARQFYQLRHQLISIKDLKNNNEGYNSARSTTNSPIKKELAETFSQLKQSTSRPLNQDETISNDRVESRYKKVMVDLILSTLSICPFSLIFEESTKLLFLLNLCRTLRILKLAPIYKFMQLGKKVLDVRFFRLTEIMIAYYILAHLITGIILSIRLADKNFADYYTLYDDQMKAANTTSIIDVMDAQTLYIQGLYLAANALTHGTIGDLDRVYEGERAWCFLQIWALMFCYMLLFASISSIFRGGDSFLSFNQKFQYVLQTAPETLTCDKLRNKINLYYDHMWKISHGYDESNEILQLLPQQLRTDALKERFQEAMESSIIFHDNFGDIDEMIINSFLNQVTIETYMPRDFILKIGAYNDNFMMVLEGEIIIVGIENDVIGILKPGAHLCKDKGTGIRSKETHDGKSIYHLITKTQVTIAIVQWENLIKLYQSYPHWKHTVRKLNNQTQARAQESLEEHLAPIIRLDPYCDEYKIEQETIERNYTETTQSLYTEIVRKVLDSKENKFLYDNESAKYKKFDIIKQHTKLMKGKLQQLAQKKKTQNSKNSRKSNRSTQPAKFMHLATLSGKKLQSMAASKSGISEDENDSSFIQLTTWARLQKFFYFSKYSRARTYANFIHFFNLLYIGFMVPFFIAFSESIEKDTFIVVESLSLIGQLIVLIVNFRTPILYEGVHTLEFQLILKSYWQKDGLLIDIMGVLPINLIFGIISHNQIEHYLFTILRLTRMVSLFKLNEVFEKLQIIMKRQSILIIVFKALLFLMILWHWTSCIWFLINIHTYDYYPVSWLKKFNIIAKSTSQQYLLCAYYVIKAVTGVGFPDMIAYNSVEKVIFILIINLGDALFAIAFGKIADLQLHVFESSEFQNYLDKLKDIEKFLVGIKADDKMRQKVQSFHRYIHEANNSHLLLETKDLKSYLPDHMIKEVLFNHYNQILMPIFQEIHSENFMLAICEKLTNRVFMPGDYIVRKDEQGDEMYFIIDGKVEIIAADQLTVVNTLSSGQCFGEVAILLNLKRIANVRAKSFTIISVLQKSDLTRIFESFPSLRVVFENLAKQRLEESLKIEAKQAIKYKFQTLKTKWVIDESFENALNVDQEANNDQEFESLKSDIDENATQNPMLESKQQQNYRIETLSERPLIQQINSYSNTKESLLKGSHQLLLPRLAVIPDFDDNQEQFGPAALLSGSALLHHQLDQLQKEYNQSHNLLAAPQTFEIDDFKYSPLRKLSNHSQFAQSQHSHISGNHPINAKLSVMKNYQVRQPDNILIDNVDDPSKRSSVLVSPDENLNMNFRPNQEEWPSIREDRKECIASVDISEKSKKNWDKTPEEDKNEIVLIEEEPEEDNFEILNDHIKFISSPPLSHNDSRSPKNLPLIEEISSSTPNLTVSNSRIPQMQNDAGPQLIRVNRHQRRSRLTPRSRSVETQSMPAQSYLVMNREGQREASLEPIPPELQLIQEIQITNITQQQHQQEETLPNPLLLLNKKSTKERQSPDNQRKAKEENKTRTETNHPQMEKVRKIAQKIRQAIAEDDATDENLKKTLEQVSVRLMQAKKQNAERRLSQIRVCDRHK